MSRTQIGDYKVEYAKSNRSKCKITNLSIPKGALRIAKMVQSQKFDGVIPIWHNFDDFMNNDKAVAEFKIGCKKVIGLNEVRPDDQKRIKDLMSGGCEKSDEDENLDVSELTEEEYERRKHKQLFDEESKAIWKLKDELSKSVDVAFLRSMLQLNDQPTKGGEDVLLKRCAQGMYFGALPRCENPECIQTNYMQYASGSIARCMGRTQWAKCTNKKDLSELTIHNWKIPKTGIKWLKTWKFTKHDKIDYHEGTTVKHLSEEEKQKLQEILDKEDEEMPDAVDSSIPFNKMSIAVTGSFPGHTHRSLETLITDNGGIFLKSVSVNCDYLVATEVDFKKDSGKVRKARDLKIPIIKSSFITESMEQKKRFTPDEIEKNDWVLESGVFKESTPRKRKQRPVDHDTKKDEPAKKKRKIQIKGRAAVDEDCEIADDVHVFDDGVRVWDAHLSLADVTSGTNSYYVLQVLQDDKKSTLVHLYRKWGRTGTNIGGNKCEQYASLKDAQIEFENFYWDKTGNEFQQAVFKKKPGKFFPLEVSYDPDDDDLVADMSDYCGSLQKPVADLVRLLFDVKKMKQSMAEMEIDTESMPLGKISKSSVQRGFDILTTIEQAINQGADENRFTALSNQFYSIVPQTKTPLINTKEIMKEKVELLESLRDMEIAVSFIKNSSAGEHPIDSHYKQLQADMVSLDKESDEFKLCQEYLQNTHAPTHSVFDLEIMDIFKISRSGEDLSFEKWKDIPNHQLLWHGSRLTNWTGIISQGLKIAPPNAPVSGYMLGKGLYFAQASSKSANYCRTSRENNEGLLLLGQVPLGDMYERLHAEFVTPEQLQQLSKHSTWGKGGSGPNPEKNVVVNLDGVDVTVPKGKLRSTGVSSSLLYDEFVVYDESQVRFRYLLRVKFNYKTGGWW